MRSWYSIVEERVLQKSCTKRDQGERILATESLAAGVF